VPNHTESGPPSPWDVDDDLPDGSLLVGADSAHLRDDIRCGRLKAGEPLRPSASDLYRIATSSLTTSRVAFLRLSTGQAAFESARCAVRPASQPARAPMGSLAGLVLRRKCTGADAARDRRDHHPVQYLQEDASLLSVLRGQLTPSGIPGTVILGLPGRRSYPKGMLTRGGDNQRGR
jgi:hypothetical protein